MNRITQKGLIAASAILVLTAILILAAEFYFTNKVIAPPRLSYEKYVLQKPGTPSSLESLKIKYENISVATVDQLRLSAWYIPNKKNTPLLLLHGHGANRMAFMKQVSYLYEAGYPLLLFDFRGSGLAPGKYVSMGVHETKDIEAMINFLEKQYRFKHFGILSNSMGANAALLTAAKDKRIVAVVCDSPFTSLVDVVELRGKRDFSFLPDWFFKLGFKVMELRLKIKTSQADGRLALQKINFPVFFIQGTQDDLDGTRFAKELLKFSPKGSQLWEVPGAQHYKNFETSPTEYKKRVLRYFEKQLSSDPYPTHLR